MGEVALLLCRRRDPALSSGMRGAAVWMRLRAVGTCSGVRVRKQGFPPPSQREAGCHPAPGSQGDGVLLATQGREHFASECPGTTLSLDWKTQNLGHPLGQNPQTTEAVGKAGFRTDV